MLGAYEADSQEVARNILALRFQAHAASAGAAAARPDALFAAVYRHCLMSGAEHGSRLPAQEFQEGRRIACRCCQLKMNGRSMIGASLRCKINDHVSTASALTFMTMTLDEGPGHLCRVIFAADGGEATPRRDHSRLHLRRH